MSRHRGRGARRSDVPEPARQNRIPAATSASHSRTPKDQRWMVPIRARVAVTSRGRLSDRRLQTKDNRFGRRVRRVGQKSLIACMIRSPNRSHFGGSCAATADLTKFSALGPAMSDFVLSRRRPRRWPLFIMPVVVLLAAAAWSAFWFYAASQVDRNVDV